MRISNVAAAIALLSAPTSISAFAPSKHNPRFLSRAINTKTFTPLSAVIDVSEYAPRNVPTFEEWAVNNGAQKMEGLEFYTEDELDWQAYTTVDIPAGTTILYVPSTMVLSSPYIEEELKAMSDGGVAAAADQLNRIGGGINAPEFYLFVKMLVEYEQEESSPFHAYFDGMPRLYFNAVSMTDFCYECLPPLVFSLSRAERVKFDYLCQVLPKVDIISDRLKQDKDVLKWAFNAVLTRSIEAKDGQGKGIAMVPMADMFNHGTDTEVEVAFDEEGNCMVYTTTDVAANAPLRMSYASATNPSYLFARYGFMDDTSLASFCNIMDIKKNPDNEEMGLDFTKMLFYHDTGDISEEVFDVVLYDKVLTNVKYHPDVETYRNQLYDAHMTGDVATKQAIHDQFRFETLSEIKKHVDTFLNSLENLAKKSEGKSLEEHPRLPLILAHNEFVKQPFLSVKWNLDALVEQYEGVQEEQWGQEEEWTTEEEWATEEQWVA